MQFEDLLIYEYSLLILKIHFHVTKKNSLDNSLLKKPAEIISIEQIIPCT